MNELIEHAQYHKKAYSDGFITFLSKHYGKLKAEHAKKHQEERKEHEKLPFQFDFHVVDFHKITFNNFAVFISSSITFVEKKDFFHHHNFYNSPDSLGIFQPPRYI
ncbi:hypothetical protein P8625_03235 [Tenacibaculum tangerinum]|uniref:Uncharacterized protein n=1 Tax=Tenacibaculum tangerinum TaxID=3038772 RepID=A0ABY8L437_9FLAO|nr:hypothetical protein [Tenacibaculum tangerinum]WGH76194.1 hypothetical protein P8625_03235 [Tenacibaculum tangerinum]